MHRSVFLRQTYVVAGLWLIISPFLLFSQMSLSQNATASEATILMFFGLLALMMAGLNSRWPDILLTGLGILLAMTLMMAPWFFGFSIGGVAEWNAGIVGLAVLVIALFSLTRHGIGRAI
ncbi:MULTISPECIES: SPW repeat domain-containing protein [Rhodobacterales]|uniref:SPW repeat domain-containing protein n=1 Tax=Rhodobacterales TaxID=204455 RepID=UPI0015EFEAE1|nr:MULTISPECIES: SPW repeat protein [Rhodobacterales]MDO6591741.1 SPW repeat protein [Yoonia sp. 1_MG-2023]